MKNKKTMTAADLIKELESNPALADERHQRDDEWRRQEEILAVAEAPLVSELKAHGLALNSVWDLVNGDFEYSQYTQLLLKHLQSPYPNAIREGIARAFAVPEARWAWSLLRDMFVNEPSNRVKSALALALSNCAGEAEIEGLAELARDSSHGESRAMLMGALIGSNSVAAKKALMDIGGDPVLHKIVQKMFKMKGKGLGKKWTKNSFS